MKYKPRHSNFDELQDEVIERVLSVHDNTEAIKDAIAKEIDDYVEAILKERVEEVEVHCWASGEHTIKVLFEAGEKDTGTAIDLFAREIPLIEIIDSFRDWDEFGGVEAEPEKMINLASRLENFAQKLRQAAADLEEERLEWERKWQEKNP